MQSRRTIRDRAFTLVELPVVIGIIAVLIGVLLPRLSGVGAAAASGRGQFVWAQDRMRELPDEQVRLQSAMGILYDGLLAEDREVVRAFIYVKDDPKHAVADAQVARLLANVRFTKSLGRLKIAHGGNPFEGLHVFLGDDFAFGLLAGEWKIDGDRATLPPDERMGGADQLPPPPLIKVRGVWRIDLSPSPAGASAEELATAIRRYAEVLEATAADLSAGKINTVEEVQRALERAPRFRTPEHVPSLVLALLPASATLPTTGPVKRD